MRPHFLSYTVYISYSVFELYKIRWETLYEKYPKSLAMTAANGTNTKM